MSQKHEPQKKKARPSRPAEPPAAAVSLYSAADIALHLAVPESWVRRVLRGFKAYRVEHAEAGATRTLFKPEVLDKVARRVEAKRIQRACVLQDDAAAYWHALGALSVSTRSLKQLAGQLTNVAAELEEHRTRLRRRPPSVVVPIHTLADEHLRLVSPVGILVRPLRQAYWRASLPEADLETTAWGLEQAVLAARELIGTEYVRLRRLIPVGNDPDASRWRVLRQLVRLV